MQHELEDLRRYGQHRTPSHMAIGASLAEAGLMFGAPATSNPEEAAEIWTTAKLSSNIISIPKPISDTLTMNSKAYGQVICTFKTFVVILSVLCSV